MLSIVGSLINLIFSERGVKILTIVALAIVVRFLINLVIHNVVQRISPDGSRAKRIRTLTSILQTASLTVIFVIAALMVLKEAGFDVTPLIASAGVVGLAVGFGAQTLVKDMISGLFLLIEGQFHEGDEVEISGKKGVVKKVSLRTVTLKDKDGVRHIIPNGTITLVSNFSKD
ncbi:MAG: mechanosensitive ion channel [Patescibacteria group bacterium]|nr:mechanosensitive ion channel [Patescibacteria group bacterium]